MKERQTISVQHSTVDAIKKIQADMGQRFGFAPSITQVIDMLVKYYNDTTTDIKGEEK